MATTTTSATTDRPSVTLSSPSELVAAVPYLLGFHPRDSLVVVGLRGPRLLTCVTARVDLPHRRHVDECCAQLAAALRRSSADCAVAVVFDSVVPGAEPARDQRSDALMAALGRRLDDAGIELRDVYVVAAGRYWSLGCLNPECCPPGGTRLSDPSATVVAAAATAQGVVVARDRDALAERLAPPSSFDPAGARALLDTALVQLTRQARGDDPGPLRRVDEALAAYRAAVVAYRDTGVLPDGEVSAGLIVAASLVSVRDELCTWCGGDWGSATQAVMLHLARVALPPYDAAVLTVFAWLTWQQGDGALASIALDRALDSDCDYTLALLLRNALDHGLPPQAWADSREELRAQLKAERRGRLRRRHGR